MKGEEVRIARSSAIFHDGGYVDAPFLHVYTIKRRTIPLQASYLLAGVNGSSTFRHIIPLLVTGWAGSTCLLLWAFR